MPKFVDMAMTEEESQKQYGYPNSPSNLPRYPYGLCISLDQTTINKLGLDTDCDVGDFLHLHALAKVTSKSEQEMEDGNKCRLELTLAFLDVEDEGEEDEEENDNAGRIVSKLYK